MTENTPIYQDIEFKEVDRKKKRHRKKHYLLRFIIFVMLCVGVFLFLKSDYFAITDIEVRGNSYYTEKEVIAIARAELGRNIIFDSGAKEIEENLLTNSYFKDAKVKKAYPAKLLVEVEERRQAAAVSFGDNFIVIDDEGVVLRQTNIDPKLTVFTGLTISKMDEGEVIRAEEMEVLATTLKMLNTMEDGDIYFKKIDVSKVVIRAYIYDNLIVKGTPNEINNAIAKGELQKVVSNLFADGISRGTITMGGDSYMSFSPEIDEE